MSDREPSFEQLGVDQEIRKALSDMGYTEPMPVQRAAIPVLLEGSDLSLRAKTGSGKTAAVAIPLVQRIDPGRKRPSLLVCAPTRELAVQLAEEIAAIGKYKGIRVARVYGGVGYEEQQNALRKASVVVGTPGRLLDMVERKALRLEDFTAVVLDEADEMLSMGFLEDVERILKGCRNQQQLVVLSASLEQRTAELIGRYTRGVVRIDLSADKLSVEGIQNLYCPINDRHPRHHFLLYLLARFEPRAAIVFANTRNDAALVATVLAREGWKAELLSGQLSQRERERVMGELKSESLRVLVATDLASRGIDVSHLTHVINYSLPDDPAVYLHRVGRTGRAGRPGVAISLVSPAKTRMLKTLEREFGVKFEPIDLPGDDDFRASLERLRLRALLDEAGRSICDGYLGLAETIVTHPQARQIVAYLLKLKAQMQHDQARSASNVPETRKGRRKNRSTVKRKRPTRRK